MFQVRRHLSRKIESNLSAYPPCVSTRVKLATSQNSPQLQPPHRGVNKKRPGRKWRTRPGHWCWTVTWLLYIKTVCLDHWNILYSYCSLMKALKIPLKLLKQFLFILTVTEINQNLLWIFPLLLMDLFFTETWVTTTWRSYHLTCLPTSTFSKNCMWKCISHWT